MVCYVRNSDYFELQDVTVQVVSYQKEAVILNMENKPESGLLQNQGSCDFTEGVLYSEIYAGDELFHMTDNAEASL